jgi:hypothetical protein
MILSADSRGRAGTWRILNHLQSGSFECPGRQADIRRVGRWISVTGEQRTMPLTATRELRRRLAAPRLQFTVGAYN